MVHFNGYMVLHFVLDTKGLIFFFSLFIPRKVGLTQLVWSGGCFSLPPKILKWRLLCSQPLGQSLQEHFSQTHLDKLGFEFFGW